VKAGRVILVLGGGVLIAWLLLYGASLTERAAQLTVLRP
jgi:hypothetical protein